MANRPRRHDDLKDACIKVALTIVEERGVEALSLRDVARRLGVSHQAPYTHFPSRDHILAEMVARAFRAFANHLEARLPTASEHEDLAAIGRAYLGYALQNPLNYRLMFATPLPDPAAHPDMMRDARHAFAMLVDGIARIHAAEGRPADTDRAAQDAMFVWSVMHGLAGILNGPTINTLGVPAHVIAETPEAVLFRIGPALGFTGSAPASGSGPPPGRG